MSGDAGRDGPAIWVGVATFDVLTPSARSLKHKRGLVTPIVERLRRRFDVSIARLAGQDRLDRETIGASVVSADPELCRAVLERLLEAASRVGPRIEASRIEIDRWD